MVSFIILCGENVKDVPPNVFAKDMTMGEKQILARVIGIQREKRG